MTSRTERAYRSASPSSTPAPILGSLEVTVGAEPNNQKTWYLPKALLAQHSTWFANLINEDAAKEEVTLDDMAVRDFQNFVDYIYSSIYSPNTLVPEYRAIRANTNACLLGARLGCKTYSTAAIRKLYSTFEPLARARDSNARTSLLRASDIEYICLHTSSEEPTTPATTILAGLRQLFFNALASHWTQRDVIMIGAPDLDFSINDASNDTTTWSHVYTTYHDFRVYVAGSLTVADVWRAAILRPLCKYIDFVPVIEGVEKEEADAESKDEGIKRPRTKIPGMRRLNSERRMRERGEVEEMGLSIRGRKRGVESEEAVEEGDDEEMGMDAGIEEEDG